MLEYFAQNIEILLACYLYNTDEFKTLLLCILFLLEKPKEPTKQPRIKDTETQKATNSSVEALKILPFQIALLALTLHLTVFELDF